jgi:diacylglycerol O-acyltransferase
MVATSAELGAFTDRSGGWLLIALCALHEALDAPRFLEAGSRVLRGIRQWIDEGSTVLLPPAQHVHSPVHLFIALTGVSDYHRRHGDALPFLRLAIPVSRRRDAAALGNHWTPGRLEIELAGNEPDATMQLVRSHMRRLRAEPSHDLLDPLAGVLRRLPSRITSSVVTSITNGVDVTASNVPGSPIPLFLQGRAVTELTPFGPLSGAATNVTLLSHGPDARIGINRDPAAVPDGETFGNDLRAAFGRLTGNRGPSR